jgi:hypothetical protein
MWAIFSGFSEELIGERGSDAADDGFMYSRGHFEFPTRRWPRRNEKVSYVYKYVLPYVHTCNIPKFG